MPSRSKLPGRTALLPTPSAALPELDVPLADSGLSSAFSQALGGRMKPGGQTAGSGFTARDTVRQARLDGPAAAKGAPRQPHIGPRSGHK